MANTEDLKSSEVKPLESSSLSSGISELMRAHEALLNTIGASSNYWLKEVHKNASAYYETWKKKHLNKKLLWCNAHQRRAERCKTEGGILLPCEIVDLTNKVEIDESQTNEKDRK